MSLNLTALNAALGAYYRQKKAEIMSKLYSQEDARKYFTVVSGIQDEYVMTEIEIAEMMQPYQKGWTPKGSVNFKPEIIKNRPVKVDYTFNPKDLEATWIGHLKTNNSSPEAYPFVEYIYDKITERLKRDINKCTVNGSYVAPTPGVAGGAMTSFDGILKVTADAITAGKIVPTATGTISAANIVSKVESVFDSVNSEFRDGELVMLISPTHRRNYFRAKRGADFQNDLTAAANSTLDFTNCTMVSPMYMNGSNRIIITQKTNLLMLEDGVNEEENIIVQSNRRELEVMVDFKRGVGFGITEGLVWANEQA
ncbi:hypothetical protein SAMN05421780_11411 [Flexibacter flexilis DSM 6793]|uniref:Uncharacterized protein n=1 Tax=Flexibacter flexilis DSM 6793 TaxID=927664 RepID=A0A1I1NC89_9BACT|nr:hypothetical protein [Flexibacter flexilis]SFC95249.1 hypothetical protein SAMN05421780_11411 [Flexibacter flexilis DSM 6793]